MVRSGSTLLETMLDAHSQIWGMGEDSVFNGNISSFRDRLVAAGNQGGELFIYLLMLTACQSIAVGISTSF